MRDFTVKLGILSPFTTRDKTVSGIKSTQAYEIIVLQRYFNAESTYISVFIILVLVTVQLKIQSLIGMFAS